MKVADRQGSVQAALRRLGGIAAGVGILLVSGLAAPIAAQDESSDAKRRHWIVTDDGQRIPTRGEWTVDGNRILYTSETGVLAMIRLSSVDLEASKQASAPPAPPPTVAPAEKPQPVLVLQSKDVARYEGALAASDQLVGTQTSVEASSEAGAATSADTSTSSQETAEGGDDETQEASARPPRPSDVTVVSWRDLGDFDKGVRLYGTLRNDGQANAFNIRVTVRVLNELGEVLEEGEATISSRQVSPGDTTNFRATFPRVSRYATVDFEVRSGR